MREILTVFFPKSVNNIKKIMNLCGIEGEERKSREGLNIQTCTDVEFTFVRNRMLISFSDDQQEEIFSVLDKMIDMQKGIGIKTYNNQLKKQVVQSLTNERYNIL